MATWHAAAALTGALAFLVTLGAGDAAGSKRDRAKPNVIVIVTDDQELASLTRRTMPNVVKHLRRPGVEFTEFVVSGPLCCPARATYLTGQYGHNNGVTWNHAANVFGPPRGGYGDLRNPANTLPVWMRRAGYVTAHVGRYLNLYTQAVGDENAVAPGWDEWHTQHRYRYFDYSLHRNGRTHEYGTKPNAYLTRVFNRIAVRMVKRYAGGRKPLFLTLDHLAPHNSGYQTRRCGTSPTPDPRDKDAFLDEPLPPKPSFNERDVSDKPPFVTERPGLGPSERAAIVNGYRCRLASLLAVDRGIGQIIRALRRKRALRDTALIFTSDNGWLSGEHRIPAGKIFPYEETLRVPMLVRLPAAQRRNGRGSGRVGAPTANVDLAPTILRLAGADPCNSARCRTLDGRSLLGLARGRRPAWAEDRAILLGLKVPGGREVAFSACDYAGVRTGRWSFVEHRAYTGAGGGRCTAIRFGELYDRAVDPFQLDNQAAGASGTQTERERELRRRLEGLEDCAGVKGRDQTPAGRRHCE